MSRNIAQHQLKHTLANTLNSLTRTNTQSRTLQPQGSEAIRVESITGYQYLAVPSGTVVPNYVYIDLESSNQDDIMIASLMRSTFMKYTDGTFTNADLQDHGLSDDFGNVWMSYDNRSTPDDMTLAYSPSGTLETRVVALLASTSLDYYKARVAVRVNRINSTTKPSNLDQYLIVYQIRAVIG